MKNQLNEIKAAIENGTWDKKADRLWGGAGLQIELPSVKGTKKEASAKGTIHCVATKYAAEVSALIEDIKISCRDAVDFVNKYEFYGRIGEAIEKYTAEHEDLKGLLLAVINEAAQCEKELNRYLYFAYGSNMDEEQMAKRCSDAKLLGKVTQQGYRFALDSSGVATLLPDESSFVEGLVWEISREDEKKLDACEGVAVNYYRKEQIGVSLNGSKYSALVYLSNRQPYAGKQRGGYMDRILCAAKSHGFSEGYMKEIEKWMEI